MSAKKNLPKLLPADQYEPTAEDDKRFAVELALGMTDPHSPLLSKIAAPVEADKISASMVESTIARLRNAASGQRTTAKKEKRRRVLVGIAAPQVGQLLRIIMVDTTIDPERKHPGKLECFINPEIIWRSRETAEGREGCFSTGLVYGLVRRPVAVKISAMTPEGKQIERVFEGFTARIVQHEIDHLEGIRFPDRIKSDRKRHWVHTEELGDYPGLIRQWHRTCSRERWEKFKTQV